MKQTWRWFGPHDQVRLEAMLQAGVEGVVTALHHIPAGDVWQTDEIAKRQAELAIAQVQVEGPVSVALFNAASTMARFFMSELGRQTYRIAVAESERFPEIGQAFYNAGPTIARTALGDYLHSRIETGELVIDDVGLAADQFIELCKASHHIQAMMGVKTEFSEAETDRIIKGAVETFLARFGAI